MLSPKIVYVEDEEDYQRLVSQMLGEAGLAVRVAGNGKEALRLLDQETPDLLLLDIQLPDTDGYTLCRALRQKTAWKKRPILMLTVLRKLDQWRNGFSCGATDYVSKPLNPPEFLERVQACLQGNAIRPVIGPDDSEYQMIRAAMAGNRGALEVLLRQYRPLLLRTITQLTRNSAEAEDAVSSAMATALERLKDFSGESSFSTWLYSIALNQLHSQWRSRASNPLQSASGLDAEFWPSAPDPSDHYLARQPDISRVQKAIADVPRPYRTALIWNLLDGLSYARIADRWRVPIGTVSKRMATAKRLLREAWDRVLLQPKEPI